MASLIRLGAVLVSIAALFAQPAIRLKGRIIVESNRGELQETTAPRMDLSRSHAMLQFAAHPRVEDLRALAARGVRVLGYLPENGLDVSIPAGAPLSGLRLKWAGRLRPGDKVSPLLAGSGRAGTFVIEFYPDVDAGDARAIALRSGFELRENPDLSPNHILVSGARANLAALAAWDEVEWIFPASDALKHGLPTRACAGALTSSGPVPQSVPIVGGWNGTAVASLALNYWFKQLTAKLPAGASQAEIVRAWNEWGKYVQVSFAPAQTEGPRTITVLFASGDHGDGYPFDGRGGVLAHTFYPAPENPETIAGDMHLDDSESWQIGANTDVFSVALHEAGHSLGLGHSDNPAAVMYPYYRRVSGLSPDDIAAIQRVYLARTTAGSGDPGSAQPPAPPAPAPAPTPAPTSPNHSAPPSLQITSPASTSVYTSGKTITISGTASAGAGLQSITWISSTGPSGNATGLQKWSTQPIALLTGLNAIIVQAADTAGAVCWRSITVTRTK